MLISESYRQLNAQLHQSRPDYGTSGAKWAGLVEHLCATYSSRDVLDYGAGKLTLQRELGFDIANYDPCIEELAAAPSPHDIVTCTDVLEHIEPECIVEVMADIRRVTKTVALLVVATRPAKKVLEDGRNAHVLLRPVSWWLSEIQENFSLNKFQDLGGEFYAICHPL